MGLIVSELYDALIEAGACPESAKAAAGAVPPADNMATKEDIARLERNMATKEDLARLESNSNERFAKIESAMATKETTNERFAKIEKQLAVLNFAVFSFGSAILAFMVKLTFFP
ncbi:MAG: hypothetical protein OXF11_16410 [Deltaproteobacteria bacterium]|nr:hypothetical protein [Deltaproteobacteria bacterium]